MRTMPSRAVKAASALLVAAGVLTACSNGGDSAESTESSQAAEATDAATVEEQESSTPEPEESSSPAATSVATEYDVNAVDFGAPGTTTPPGTVLGMGQAAWLNNSTTYYDEESNEQTAEGGLGVSILEVRALDPSLFDRFSNAADFAGYTPYAIVVQFQWLYTLPNGEAPQGLDLFPLKEDGSDAEYLTGSYGFGASNECGLLLPEYDPTTNIAVTCIVGLSQDLPVTTAEYNGETYFSVIAGSDNQYFPNPVTWQ